MGNISTTTLFNFLGKSKIENQDEKIKERFPGLHPDQTLSFCQLHVVESIVETFIAPLTPEQTEKLIHEYNGFTEDALTAKGLTRSSRSDIEVVSKWNGKSTRAIRMFVKVANVFAPKDLKLKIRLLLYLLSTWLGCFLLCGVAFKPFYELTLEERERALIGWSKSKISLVRGLFGAFKNLSVFGSFEDDQKEIWEALQYPGPDPKRPSFADYKATNAFEPEFFECKLQENKSDNNNKDQVHDDATKLMEMECDVVVIGSGAGGGVIASEMSDEGKSVIVLEKGDYISPPDLPLEECDILENMLERRGALTSESLNISVMAGRTWGGGTWINWSASLKTPQHVRLEWATKYGLTFAVSEKFTKALDKVCQIIGVTTENVHHNQANQILLDGCKKLQINGEVIPQNTAGRVHECGWCTMGCPYGEVGKQSSPFTWLKNAASKGAKFIQRCQVTRIVHENGIAKGVEAIIFDNQGKQKNKLFVKAQIVVCSAGAINTPLILKDSGLKNQHIGRNLRLHPCSPVVGTFPDKHVRHFEGSIMTSLSKHIQDFDGLGYGCLIETPTFHPAIAGLLCPWNSMYDFKQFMSLYDRQVALIPLTRDYDSVGCVFSDAGSTIPKVDWKLSKHDSASLEAGVELCIRILIAAGARTIRSSQFGLAPFHVQKTENPLQVFETHAFRDYIQKVKRIGIKSNTGGLVCAHQMGTCRMAMSPQLGGCNERGQTWEIENLYVADASLFPTASGVNPMVTTYALSYYVAQCIKEDINLRNKKNK